ncbi:MAG TPA: alpha/beta fold hydrolase [Solirubrobacteraceae bacterium]|nr:alpha/beta fold hydrolase [Solirubrobacteraceae bacterium]
MATFVLVQPAWMGGWCWIKVAAQLRGLGHEVYAPTLTGLAERSHLASPAVGLPTHVEDVASVVVFEDLYDIILVGTSSGGTVITGVADVISDRIASLVYLDAFLPADGQCTLDLLPHDRRDSLEKLVEAEGDGWLLPRFAPPPWSVILSSEVWQVTDGSDVEWMLPRLRPTPLRHFTDPVRVRQARGDGIARTYIRCSGRPPAPFDMAAASVQSKPGWQSIEIDTPHVPYVTHPNVVTETLIEVAASR